MRNPLRRHYGQNDLHFLTFSCYRRQPFLATIRARNGFVKALEVIRSRHKFLLIGYVVMPEHVHLLISEPTVGNPSKALQALKQKVSRALRGKRKTCVAQLRLPFRSAVAAPAFWQRRFYDFNVWSTNKLKEKLDYMHADPVERRLVSHPKDWAWSSWSHYARGKRGLIRIDVLEELGAEKASQIKGKSKSTPAPLNSKGAAPRHTSAFSG
jgi:putative transposase